MFKQKIKQLAEAKAHLARLELSLAKELRDELAGLPAAFGFASRQAFSRAFAAAAGGKDQPGSAIKVAQAIRGSKRRKRAIITNDTRAAVKRLAGAGKTGREIAQELGISLPSVQNIKKSLGLVKARK